MFKKLSFGCLAAFILLSTVVKAQLDIPEYHQLYRVKVWRDIDLREKQNKGFFAFGHEVTSFILNAIADNKIKLYEDRELKTEVPDVARILSRTEAPPMTAYDPAVSYNSGEIVTYQGKYYKWISPNSDYGREPTDVFYWSEVTLEDTKGQNWSATDIVKLQLIEDVIFDKVRSRLYYDIESIYLAIPGDIQNKYDQNVPVNAPALPIGYVDYAELEKVFRADENAKWVNRYNPKEWKNFADAFLLRLFYGPIVKYENPDDSAITEMFDTHFDAVMEMARYEMFLMEKEHNLWEY